MTDPVPRSSKNIDLVFLFSSLISVLCSSRMAASSSRLHPHSPSPHFFQLSQQKAKVTPSGLWLGHMSLLGPESQAQPWGRSHLNHRDGEWGRVKSGFTIRRWMDPKLCAKHTVGSQKCISHYWRPSLCFSGAHYLLNILLCLGSFPAPPTFKARNILSQSPGIIQLLPTRCTIANFHMEVSNVWRQASPRIHSGGGYYWWHLALGTTVAEVLEYLPKKWRRTFQLSIAV